MHDRVGERTHSNKIIWQANRFFLLVFTSDMFCFVQEGDTVADDEGHKFPKQTWALIFPYQLMISGCENPKITVVSIASCIEPIQFFGVIY